VNDRLEPVDADAEPTHVPLPMRVFTVEYVNDKTESFSAQLYDTMNGNLVFIDCVRVGRQDRLYHRRTIAAGQWRQITEVTGGTVSGWTN
jgi:hypothetical protein